MNTTKGHSYGHDSSSQRQTTLAKKIRQSVDVLTQLKNDKILTKHEKLTKAKVLITKHQSEINTLTAQYIDNNVADYGGASHELFSNKSQITAAQSVMLPKTLELIKEGKAIYSNANQATAVVELSKQGFIGSDTVNKINEIHTPEIVTELERLKGESHSFGLMSKEYTAATSKLFNQAELDLVD